MRGLRRNISCTRFGVMHKRDTRDAWQVSPTQFPQAGPIEAQLEFLLRYAILAPSSHNTQPWIFRISAGAIELFADESRSLSVIDPLDRQLIMSCGAALLNLRVAMRRFGWDDLVHPFPEASNINLLARITPGASIQPSDEDLRLCDAIPLRHTNRQPFRLRPVSETIADELINACASEKAWLVRLLPAAKYSAADLISLADRDQFANADFRNELSEWLVSNSSQRGDGIPGYSKSYGPTTSYGTSMLVRTFDIGGSVAATEKELVEGSPMLAVLGTGAEDPVAWLEAGQAMERMLLTAQLHGLSASFLNQPLELANYRAQFSALTEHEGYPQLIMRIGYGPETAATPRRALEEVIADDRPMS
jgi:hypothetical protein